LLQLIPSRQLQVKVNDIVSDLRRQFDGIASEDDRRSVLGKKLDDLTKLTGNGGIIQVSGKILEQENRLEADLLHLLQRLEWVSGVLKGSRLLCSRWGTSSTQRLSTH
jgi:hypothetical protein